MVTIIVQLPYVSVADLYCQIESYEPEYAATSHSTVAGSSIWDQLAARQAGVLGVGLLSGGYDCAGLETAGAFCV